MEAAQFKGVEPTRKQRDWTREQRSGERGQRAANSLRFDVMRDGGFVAFFFAQLIQRPVRRTHRDRAQIERLAQLANFPKDDAVINSRMLTDQQRDGMRRFLAHSTTLTRAPQDSRPEVTRSKLKRSMFCRATKG